MRICLAWLLCLVVLGCQLVEPGIPGAAEESWQETQKGETQTAAAPADTTRSPGHLSLAAAYVEKGDDARACAHLGLFLEGNPGHKNARFYYAELLLRLKRREEARDQFERAIADAQQGQPIDMQHLVHCHGRLLEIAQSLDDEYLAHLHRGIGLYQLAQVRSRLDEPEGEMPTEALLCKAAAELTQARGQRPEEARPCWYLYCVWQQLAQQQHARRWLQDAGRWAPFSYLTPCEQTRLALVQAAVSKTHP